MAGHDRTSGTGIRSQIGQRATEGAGSITKQFPAPPPQSGAGTNPSRRGVRIAAGRPGGLQEGWPAALSRRAATNVSDTPMVMGI